MNDFSNWLRLKLDERDWKPTYLAKAAGVSDSVISRILSGARVPNIETIRKISDALNVTIGEALRHAGIDPDIDPNSAKEKEVLRIMQNASPQAVDDILEFARHRFALAKKRGESHASNKQNP